MKSFVVNPGRLAGSLYLLMSILGAYAMLYVPQKLIVPSNALATARNIAANETVFRLGIVSQLISEAGFVLIALALYDLLKHVNRRYAMVMVLSIVLAVPIAFANELNSLAALILVRGTDFLSVVEEPHRNALAMLFLQLHHFGFVINEFFSGLWLFPLALLVYRSQFLPRFLGVWLALAGFAWILLCLTGILMPQAHDLYTYAQPALFGEVAFMLWLVIQGARPHASGAA